MTSPRQRAVSATDGVGSIGVLRSSRCRPPGHHQGEQRADHGQRGQHPEDRVGAQARRRSAGRRSPGRRPRRAGRTRRTRPRRRRARWSGSSWPRSRRSASGCRWCPGPAIATKISSRASGRLTVSSAMAIAPSRKQPATTGFGPNRSATREPIERADDGAAVEHQQERQRALGVVPGAQHQLRQPGVERVDQQQTGRAHQAQQHGRPPGTRARTARRTRPAPASAPGSAPTGGGRLGQRHAGLLRQRARLLDAARGRAARPATPAS